MNETERTPRRKPTVVDVIAAYQRTKGQCGICGAPVSAELDAFVESGRPE